MRGGSRLSTSAVHGAVARLRPILMTALMAGLGLLPAALSHGIGSETQRPFAVVIVGGIVSATLFTLLLLPLAYPYFQERKAMPDRLFPGRRRRHVLALLRRGGARAAGAFAPCQRLGRWRDCITVPLAPAQQDLEAKQFQPPATDRARLYMCGPAPWNRVSVGRHRRARVAQLAPMTMW